MMTCQLHSTNHRLSFVTYGDIHALLSDSLEAAHDILLHLHELRELLGQVRAEGATGIATKGVSWETSARALQTIELHELFTAVCRKGRRCVVVGGFTHRNCSFRRIDRTWLRTAAGEHSGNAILVSNFGVLSCVAPRRTWSWEAVGALVWRIE